MRADSKLGIAFRLLADDSPAAYVIRDTDGGDDGEQAEIDVAGEGDLIARAFDEAGKRRQAVARAYR